MPSSLSIEQVDVDVEDWIDGATFTQAAVTIYRNPGIHARYQPLLDRIAALEAVLADLTRPAEAPSGDATLADTTRARGEASLNEEAPDVAAVRADLDTLYEQAQSLYDEYEADKEVWTLRALDRAEIAPLMADLDAPVEPTPPGKDAKPAAVTRWRKSAQAYQDARVTFQDEVNVRMIAAATLSVQVRGQDKPAPSLDGVRRVLARPHGRQHIAQLAAAIEAITLQEVAIPAPHRPGA